MTDRGKLGAVVQTSRMFLDLRLAALERAARARAETLARLADLEVADSAGDLPLAVAAQARLRYETWAEARRAEINLILARQTAEWIDARDDARRAFGRADVLAKLSAKARS